MLIAVFFYCGLIMLCCLLIVCYAEDTIRVKSNRAVRDGQTLISAGERFVLGFFTPPEIYEEKRYVGIWYKLNPRVVVWVANIGDPLFDTSGNLTVEDGNLKIFDKSGKLYWSTNLEQQSRYDSHGVATLMDSGNLVLKNQLARIIWQSFEHPTDTFLPGMNMNIKNLALTSWSGDVDPTPGNFIFKQDQEESNQFVIEKGHILYWKSRDFDQFYNSQKLRSEISDLLSGDFYNYTNARIVMSFTGEIQYWKLGIYENEWALIWSAPKDRCSVFEACGSFGSCNINNFKKCKCLPGFKPKFPENWNGGDFSNGCIRNSTSCGMDDDFLSLKMMKVETAESKSTVQNETACKSQCLSDCRCQAYSYIETKNSKMRGDSTNCLIWTNDLSNLQEEYLDGGEELFVRVASSELESTVKSCKACGTNAIPYPLSTGLNCGDPMYICFDCNESTGKLTFKAPSGTYNVTNINPITRTFLVQAKEEVNCRDRNGAAQLNRVLNSSQFTLNKVSCAPDESEFSSDNSLQGVSEIEISWKPPPQPTCVFSTDCKDWPHSTCSEINGTRRCYCNANFRWDGQALNCTPVAEGSYHKPFGGGSTTRKKPLFLIIGVTTIASAIVLLCAIAYISIYIFRRRMAKRREKRENSERNAAMLYGTEKRVKDLIESEDFKEEDKKGIDVPFFDLESILAATDNFSDVNKLGRGAFGPVYKGIFPGGQEIAIKRLSSVSGQGLEEFKNEVILIARLQHRNLVRLLGYCIKGDEKILLYEYMPNKSLDLFIYDQKLSINLNWEMRFDIILGVARGLLYLHQDSRLRIIHRDMKTSNILLDAEMNPKISDFGLARMFEGKQTQGITNKVVGTQGYMSPEYALDGLFSVKSDVYSFGVVVLEILSGRRNARVDLKTGQVLKLPGYAWKLWSEDKAFDFLDETLSGSCKKNEFLKCLNIALLCVQDDPIDRPAMSNVVVMLSSNETGAFPTPKQPAFVVIRETSSIAASTSSNKVEIMSDWETTLGGGR